MKKERLKHLLKSVIGVDVAGIALRTLAATAVQRATEAMRNSAEWEDYMDSEGALILLPRALRHVGRGAADEEQ